MAFFNGWPFTQFQEQNLDWIIRHLKDVEQTLQDYIKGFTFADPLAWDITTAYEPLTFVQYNNDIYGSKQAVPAGIAITNTSYWVRFSSYTAVMAAITALGARVTALENQVAPSSRNMIVVSDSYGLGRNGEDDFIEHMVPLLPNYDNVYNWSNGSTGIVHQGDSGYRAIDLMQANEASITDKNSITEVMICMGANDIADHGSFDTYARDLWYYIKNTYTKADIYIGFIGNILAKTGSEYLNYIEVLQLYQKFGAAYRNTKYLVGVENVMHDATLMQADGVHPLTAGSVELAKAIVGAFKSGSYVYRNSKKILDAACVLETSINGDVATISWSSTASTATSFTDRNYKLYHTPTETPVVRGIAGSPVLGTVHGYDSALAPTSISMQYYNGLMYLASMRTTAWDLVASGAIYGCTVSIPTIRA